MNNYEIKAKEEKPWLPKRVRSLQKTLLLAVILVVLIVLIIGGLCLAVGLNISARKDAEYADQITELQQQIQDLMDNPVVIEPVTPEIDLAVIDSKLQVIGELATVEYLYTDANRFSDPKEVLGISIPFTTKSFVAKWDGIIKAGIDVAQLRAELKEKEKVILVYLPAPRILSHEIKMDTVETLDEKSGLFNPIKVDDVNSLYAVSKDAMEQRAKENGLLVNALENAKQIISSLLATVPGFTEEHTVEFQLIY